MKIVPVRWIDEVLDIALERPLVPKQRSEDVVAAEGEPAREPESAPPQPDVTH
jgi:hypothetical protein